ncbi:FGGY-family carbohydrate kinase [Catenuloplanes japonicus]|uniref:FGGY-family carbohydrate kinase n=1 Tax=Catenuloplanes japonicus TaxID=33876 RepID=UPI000526CF47|nr:FGGY-family carbohydrate kinase [Catenuloplanes japonicus]
MTVLLAMDLGTEGARVGAFDAEGRLLATAHSGYPTSYPQPGRAEQDPRAWWSALVSATRSVLDKTGKNIAAIGLATTASTVVALDEGNRPLRPALLWMDARADREAALTAELAEKHPVLAFSGGADAVEWLVPKAVWLARNEPETYRRATRIVESVDYLTHRLTGAWVGSRMNATCKWNYDSRTGLPTGLYADLGVPDLADKLPNDIRAVGTPAGTLLPAVAAELGIEGTPVVAVGGIDAHVSLAGVGGGPDGLVSVVAGTSTAFVTETPQPIFAPTIWGPYPSALRDGRWLIEGGQVSSGSVLRWVCEDILGLPRAEMASLLAAANEVPAAGHGLAVLDSFMGNRTPHRDPRLRGAIIGLSVGTTRAEIYRAAVEAVAYGTRAVLESFTDAGIPADRVVLSGGIRHNPLWLDVTTEVLGREVELVDSGNLTLCACAALAATACGTDLEEARATFAPPTVTKEPQGETVYEDGYRLYHAATAALRPLMHDMTGDRG